MHTTVSCKLYNVSFEHLTVKVFLYSPLSVPLIGAVWGRCIDVHLINDSAVLKKIYLILFGSCHARHAI